jgi:hypothetical protein
MTDFQDSNLRQGDNEAAAVAKTANRVTLDSMHDKIATIEYLNPESAPTLTIAVVTLDNGYTVTGESAAADPKNFDKGLGRKFAAKAAVRKIWSLEGYLLREKLHKENQA